MSKVFSMSSRDPFIISFALVIGFLKIAFSEPINKSQIGQLDQVYVNHERGDDSRVIVSEEEPLKTFRRAFELVQVSGTVFIQKTTQPYTEKLHVIVGGNLEKPLRVIATGAEINLGSDISSGSWLSEGDYFIYDKIVKRNYKGAGVYQMAALWIDGISIHPYNEKLKQRQYVTYLDDGRMKILFPKGVDPTSGKHKIILNADFRESAVSFGHDIENVVVDGLKVKHSGNDGFNLHGSGKKIVLKNVISLFNGDEGISAHGELQVRVEDSIIAYNGSLAGGIADVGESESYYKNCIVFCNDSNAFYFSGKKHTVENCIVWGNKGKVNVSKSTEFIEKNLYQYKDKHEVKANLNSVPLETRIILQKSLKIAR